MSLFTKKQKSTPVMVIIGGGRLGGALSDSLSNEGYRAIVVDKYSDALSCSTPGYAGNTLWSDATDESVMKAANFQNAAAIFVMTSSDTTNLFIAQILRQKLGREKKIISRLNDPMHAEAYSVLVMETVSVETVFACEVIKNLSSLTGGCEI